MLLHTSYQEGGSAILELLEGVDRRLNILIVGSKYLKNGSLKYNRCRSYWKILFEKSTFYYKQVKLYVQLWYYISWRYVIVLYEGIQYIYKKYEQVMTSKLSGYRRNISKFVECYMYAHNYIDCCVNKITFMFYHDYET
jgi:hypothetical protein